MKAEAGLRRLSWSGLIAIVLGVFLAGLPTDAALIKIPGDIEWNDRHLAVPDCCSLLARGGERQVLLLRARPGFLAWLLGNPLREDPSLARVYFFGKSAYERLSHWDPLQVAAYFPGAATEALPSGKSGEQIHCFGRRARAEGQGPRKMQLVIEFSDHADTLGVVGTDAELPALLEIVQSAVALLIPEHRADAVVAACVQRVVEAL